jgi:ferredoxin-NAD(P)+ reductase (naphthalene dioxygenase ferredoxin-specific)
MVEGPFGSSYLREQHTGPILCIAGGLGLAPIKGIVEAAMACGTKQPIHIYYGARSDRDLYLVDHFEGLAQRPPNLSFTPVLSDAPLRVCWRTGFVTDAVAEDMQDFDGWKTCVAAPHRWSKRLCRYVRHAGCALRTCMPMCFYARISIGA